MPLTNDASRHQFQEEMCKAKIFVQFDELDELDRITQA